MTNEQIFDLVVAVVAIVSLISFIFLTVNHELYIIIGVILFIALYMVVKIIVVGW